MLVEIKCEKLIKTKLLFEKGLNALTGLDDGTNSIGKSSVLMLIDFVFGGDDFIKRCPDVIENVGHLELEYIFRFKSETFRFSRSTKEPETILFYNKNNYEEITITDYRMLLKNNYLPHGSANSFRETVNLFARIWGKDNHNPNRPLNAFPNEPYAQIRKNIIRLFGFEEEVKLLEKTKKDTEKKKKNLKGTFDEGYIKKITKPEIKKNQQRISEIVNEVEDIKKNLGLYTLNINQVVNKENLKLKTEKDQVLDKKTIAENQLFRIKQNLKYGSSVSKKYFERLEEFFPEVSYEKLNNIEDFHTGVSKILKSELKKEKDNLVEKIEFYDKQLIVIDEKLKQSIGMVDKPVKLIDRMLEISIEERMLSDQLKYRVISDEVEESVKELSEELAEKIISILKKIELLINKSMENYISQFYEDNPVVPSITLTESNYHFNHNNDAGTGKSYANMIAMDLSFLKHTYLPFLIHDSMLFKNVEVHAVEKIIYSYSLLEKQVFISIDELSKYNEHTKGVLGKNIFMALSGEMLAFNKSWKKRV